ncbi:hypothetical protein [Methylobacterium sp. SI9]|uniref:hypothetical protein n=1 Tax=Methylobacterium guangdongense TaxID=3138811 RepID=UPI00313BE70E
MNIHQIDVAFDAAMRAAFGMSDERYARFKAACPGGGTADLIQRLRPAPKDAWTQICEQHAVERAQEACTEYKDGDLIYRTGDFIWALYWTEFDNALKSIGCRRRRTIIYAAGTSFMEEVERIRDRRLGPSELRDQMDTESLDYSPTLGDLMERQDEA